MSKQFYEINDIPNHWEVSRLKYVFEFSNETSTEYELQKNLALTKKGIVEKNIELNEGQIARDYKKYIFIKENQICLNPMDLLSGWVDISPINGLISPAYYTLIPKENFDVKFLNYFLQSNYYRKTFFSIGKGIASHDNYGRWVLTPEEFKNIFIFYPKLEEQKLISKYIEKKTEMIDLLIDKTHKKIALLKEQRLSLINQCVTKGLDLNVKMKDSGIEWIGKIPEHWSFNKLGFLGQFSNGVSKGSEYFGYGNPFLNYSDVYQNEIIQKPSGLFRSNENDWERYSVKKGDIFFTRTSETIDDIGVSSVCIETIERSCFSGFLVRFRPNDDTLQTDYSRFYFRSFIPLTHFSKEMNLVTRASLSQGTLKTTPILIPPSIEQEKIVKFLTKKLGTIDKISKKEIQKIQMLQEYRQSLISFIIMGKFRITENMI